MKAIFIILLFFIFSTLLNGAYLRTIRVGTFLNPEDAQDALLKLEVFVNKHNNLQELQKNSAFELKFRSSGDYYITLIEPFTQREVLQEVLDTLRLEYTDVYVTKLSKMPQIHDNDNDKKLDSTPMVDIQEQKPKQYEEKKALTKTENFSKDTLKENQIPILKSTLKTTTPPQETRIVKTEEHEQAYFWQILSFVLFCANILLVALLFKLKKKNEHYHEKDLIHREKIKQVQHSLDTKEQFLSHSSHELRTPMTAILGLTHLVLENELPKFQREYIQKIQISAEHLVSIINDILDISKIEAGKLKLEQVEFNLNEVLDYVLNIISMQTKKNDVKIKLEVDSDVPSMIIGDSLRLGQILVNLLGNSVKFTMEGEVGLHIKLVSNLADTLALEFIISDTGIGMSEDQIKNAFSSYNQAEISTSRKFGGTGLGLSISKQLVEMMHGKIKLSSQQNVGTTFNFHIPFKVKNPQERRYYRLPSKELLDKRILIVDASRYNTNSLLKAFSYFNYKCHIIPAFEEAVLEYAMHFHIIVIHQDRLSNFAIRKIHDLKKNAIGETKLVLLNDIHSSFNSQIVKSIKIDAFFKTPFTQQSILELITDLYLNKDFIPSINQTNMKDKLIELSPKKVLVAEDNLLNHKVIAGLLAKTSIELTFVGDGQEVLSLIEKGEVFDLVLMDINMPNMNGYDATKEIRKDQKNDNLPILALTADVMTEAIDKTFEVGMQGHISKPIIVDIFYKKILDSLTVSTSIHSTTNAKNTQAPLQEDLSVTMGLNRCDDDIEFYKSILTEFKTIYLNSAVSLEELCHNGNFKEARQKAMDIKDVALNIGAYNLCENAAAMEYEFEKGPRSNYQELISSYSDSLDRLFTDIDKYLKKS